MSKKVKTIIAGSIALAVLVAAVVLLLLLPKSTKTEEVSPVDSDSELIEVLVADSNKLVSAHIKNEKDEYTIETLGEKKWGIKSLDSIPQVDEYSVMASDISNIYANSIVEENCEDLAKFGLDKPTLTVDLKYSDGKTAKISVGDVQEQNLTAYTMIDDKKTVYQVTPTKFSSFNKGMLDFVDKAVTPLAKTDENGQPQRPNISYIKLTGTNFAKPLEFKTVDPKTKSPNYVPMAPVSMVTPVIAEVSTSSFEKVFTTILGIQAIDIAAINPTPKELTEYGFDAPTAILEMKYDETSNLKMTVGKEYTEKGNHYVMMDGTPIVYVVSDNTLTWLHCTPKDIISSIPVLAPILDLKGVDVKINGATHSFLYKQGEKVGEETSEMTATLNGKETDIDNAKKYLQLLYSAEIEDLNDQEAPATPEITIAYNYLDGKVDKVEIFVREDRKTIVSVNGNKAFVGRAGFIEKLKRETQNLLDGKIVDTDL